MKRLQLISVLIVDDEYLVIQDLRSMLNWESLGFRIVATASNGKKALDLYRIHKPQLIVTDIRMPVMDGLDFIEAVQKENSGAYVLILTAYDDFGYAKRAIENGVADYLLKSEITKATLESKLLDIHSKLILDTRRRSLSLREELSEYFLSEKSYINQYPHLEKIYAEKYFFFLLAEHVPLSTRYQSKEMAAQSLDKYAAILSEWLPDAFRVSLLFTVGSIIIAGIQMDTQTKLAKLSFEQQIKLIHQSGIKKVEDKTVLFYHPTSLTISGFKDLFQGSIPQIVFSLRFPSSDILSLADLRLMPHDTSPIPFDFSLLQKYRQETDRLFQYVDMTLDKAFENRNLSAIISFYTNICIHFEIMSEYQISLNDYYYFGGKTDFLKWIRHTYTDCLKALDENHKDYSSTVEKAVAYIKVHYSDASLSGEDIAASVELSYGRLGVLFKQETGKTINEYLTDIRVGRALQMLKNSNYKIYEIAEQVGYNSSQYFSQIIYRKTGKRPIDFKS